MTNQKRRLLVQSLEDRRVLALLGLQLEYPQIFANSTGSVTYDAATDRFSAKATPLDFTAFDTSGSGPTGIIDPPNAVFRLDFLVDDAGDFVGGIAGDDFTLSGSLSDFATGFTADGVLLTGEVIAFGYSNGSVSDLYEVELQVTGGLLNTLPSPGGGPAYFAGKNIGIFINSENSSFSGSFHSNFSGGNKSDVGPTEPTASLGDFVWYDDNSNGIQDDDEAGVPGVTVTLTGGGLDGMIGSGGDDTTATMVTDGDGKYLFTNLNPGEEYKVTFSDLPPGYVFTAQDVGGDTLVSDAVDSDADPVTGMTIITTLDPGEQDLSWDAGIVRDEAEVQIEKYVRVDDPPVPAIDIEKYVKPVIVHSGDVCDTIGKPFELTFEYDPGTAVDTLQDSGKAGATGGVDATPDDSFLVVNDGGSHTYFSGTVPAGETFTALSSQAGSSNFGSNTEIFLYDNEAAYLSGASPLQSMQYHTSCSQPIRLGDRVGSVIVAGLAGDEGTIANTTTGYGDDADLPTGPQIPVGNDVMWTYVVTNPDPNNQPVGDVVVIDDAGTPDDPSDDLYPSYVEGDDDDGLLEPGEVWIYTATDTVSLAGQYRNIGKVTGNVDGDMVMDDDPAHYLGVNEGVGVVCDDVGRPVQLTFDYIGGADLNTAQDSGKAGVSGNPDATPSDSFFYVTDSTDLQKVYNGEAKDYFSGTIALGNALTAMASNAGQTRFSSNMMIYLFDNEAAFNANQTPLQTMQYHTSCSQPINLGDVIGGLQVSGAVGESGSSTVIADELPPLGPLVLLGPTVLLGPDIVFDPSDIGVDADDPTGPMAQLGDKITFTYEVTNPGSVPLTNVIVTDNTAVTVEAITKPNGYNFGDLNNDGALDPNETWYFQAVEIADSTGQQMNVGKVTADPNMVMDDDPAHHFVNPLDLEKFTRGEAETSGLTGVDVCDDIGLDKFASIILSYNGGNFISNPQEGRATVEGTLADPPPTDVFIVGSKDSNGDSDLFFSGTVSLGGTFELSSSFSGTDFGSETFVLIYNADPSIGGTLLQHINFHTSCSKPLGLGDIFGGVTFVGATDEDGDTATLPTSDGPNDFGQDADLPEQAVEIPLGDKVVFTYAVSNLGDAPIVLDNVVDDNGTPGDPDDDLYWIPPSGFDQAIMQIVDENGHNVGDINGDDLLDPNEVWLFEAMDIVRQEGLVGNKGVVTGTLAGVALMDMDFSHHKGVLPAIDLCETGQKPQQLNFRYTASDDFANGQGDKSEITVSNGSLVGVSSVFVRVTDDSDAFKQGATLFAGGTVHDGQVFGVDAMSAGDDRLPSTIYLHFLDPVTGALIRTVEIHASCSAPLVLGDDFAGAELVGFVGDGGAVLGLQPDAAIAGDGNIVAGEVLFAGRKLKFTLTNVGNTEAVLESLMLEWAESNKKLKKIKIDGVEVFRTETAWTSSGVNIGDGDWKSNTLDDRTIAAGQIVFVEIEFESDVSETASDYMLTMTFDVDDDDDGPSQSVSLF
ncbi:DUF7467 domain-containing protein [Stieleria magnilauensis]|uniref:Serine-aspartate repeat-containing protein D n=1 Tax=Stieleria magnilauensis TaxID=2527963 RepID=A0ABX5XM68_9BACT|nr:Serine-aspartate repeat-containing protein D precursor [Planctomycetes bacterium TBK1r]